MGKYAKIYSEKGEIKKDCKDLSDKAYNIVEDHYEGGINGQIYSGFWLWFSKKNT